MMGNLEQSQAEHVGRGFTKEQHSRSSQFRFAGQDVLEAVLEDDKKYTKPEVKRLMEAWLHEEAK